MAAASESGPISKVREDVPVVGLPLQVLIPFS